MSERQTNAYKIPNTPMYGWSLSSSGRPMPISLAQRGSNDYICPICEGNMIARKGEVNQHHYAHDRQSDDCTPDAVAEAIAGKWLVLSMGTMMVLGEPLFVHFMMNGQRLTANLLQDVTSIVEHQQTLYGDAEISLVQEDGTIRAVLMLNLQQSFDRDALASFTANGIPVIWLPTQMFRSGHVEMDLLFQNAEVHGGWYLQGRPADLPELLVEPEKIRYALLEAVRYPPYKFWSPLMEIGNRDNILRVNDKLMWIPDNVWNSTVGGGHNKLSNDLDVVIQEWPQNDGSTIILYYIMLKDDRAVAIRRFMPGESVHASIDARFRMLRATAEQVAQHLATT